MSHLKATNEEIWDKLARKDVLCARPKINLTVEKAREYVAKDAFYGDLQGKHVLCLACGGGQQSAAFGLLGAIVTVVDFSEEQLIKEREVADHYQIKLTIIKADMRDLSMLRDQSFDIVYQPYSINYIPQIESTLNEVSRVLKHGGIYDLMLHNPFVHGTWKDGCWGSAWELEDLWRGKGYPIWQPYRDGYPIKTEDPHWNFKDSEGRDVRVKSPQEYRHTLSTVLNGLIQRNLEIKHFREENGESSESRPGSWEHYKSCAPPWLYILSKKT